MKTSNLPCAECRTECLSEFSGTFLLVFIGPASIIVASLIPGLQMLPALLLIASAFGGTVTALILILGKYSGSLVNPALTLATATARQLKRRLVLPYLFFQVLGGLAAGLGLRTVFGSADPGTALGSARLAGEINSSAGIMLEALGTFILASSALLVSTRFGDRRAQALLMGATLFLLILLIGPLTGAGLNPARSLGPSLASGYFENLYVYISGPLLGGLAAGLVFRVIRSNANSKGNLVCLC